MSKYHETFMQIASLRKHFFFSAEHKRRSENLFSFFVIFHVSPDHFLYSSWMTSAMRRLLRFCSNFITDEAVETRWWCRRRLSDRLRKGFELNLLDFKWLGVKLQIGVRYEKISLLSYQMALLSNKKSSPRKLIFLSPLEFQIDTIDSVLRR